METEIRGLLARTPFQPVRIHTSSGQTYDVTDPGSAMLLKNRLFVAFADRERWTLIPQGGLRPQPNTAALAPVMLSEAKHLACLRQSARFFVAALLRMTGSATAAAR